jgi:hypothetical protein
LKSCSNASDKRTTVRPKRAKKNNGKILGTAENIKKNRYVKLFIPEIFSIALLPLLSF